eukprot:TRINITY_DN121441_c0_g1_i1.p1 TRINITY_DN121441_c0_g1~~TRINITY_DN121441_c0_g1_i1.p1  ORF type:complete len:369 (-),score=55.85 TRINITY_DN121441_c0_g1_i1:42-1148(-)
MGAGASAALKNATQDELTDFLRALPAEDRGRLAAAVRERGEGAGGNTEARGDDTASKENEDVIAHQRLGITRNEAWKLVQRIKFPILGNGIGLSTPYKRTEKMSWITEKFGEFNPEKENTGYDLGAAIRAWLRETKSEKLSACEVLTGEGCEEVGQATVFYSHVQSIDYAWVDSVLRVLLDDSGGMESVNSYLYEGGRFVPGGVVTFWLDYFVLRQCMNDFKVSMVKQVVSDIGWTVAEIDMSMSYLERTFCVFELFATVQSKATLRVMPLALLKHHLSKSKGFYGFKQLGADLPVHRLVHMKANERAAVLKVDSKSAQTRDPRDKMLIDEYISTQLSGGHAELDSVVSDRLQKDFSIMNRALNDVVE